MLSPNWNPQSPPCRHRSPLYFVAEWFQTVALTGSGYGSARPTGDTRSIVAVTNYPVYYSTDSDFALAHRFDNDLEPLRPD